MLRLFIFLLFLLSSFSSQAAESVVVGEHCTTLGASTMTTDHKNIAVCLENDSGKLFWKASTQASTSSEMCGLATQMVTFLEGTSNPTSTLPSAVIPCNGTDLVTATCTKKTSLGCSNTVYSYTCPNGYTMTKAQTGAYTSTTNTQLHQDEKKNRTTYYYLLFCLPD